MLIVRLTDGLGNQMQQYALYRGLLRHGLDKNVKCDIDWQKNAGVKPFDLQIGYFKDIPIDLCTDEERKVFLKDRNEKNTLLTHFRLKSNVFKESKMYHSEIFRLKNKYIYGYFACQKYYDNIMRELQDLFRFPKHPDQEIQKKNIELMDMMDQTESVSIHIRRGDYLWTENEKLFGNISTDEYYNSAMNYFRERYTGVHFYIFSDDAEYVRATFQDKKQYTVVDYNTGKNSLFDIQLMSHCHGNICANSTFSFWGTRLNRHKDKVSIRPLTMRNNQKCDPRIMHEYWPGWIMIDRDGSIR